MRHLSRFGCLSFLLFSTNICAAAATAGCLGKSVDDCIAQVETTMVGVDRDEVRQSLQFLDRVDVNGKRVAKTLSFVITGTWPGTAPDKIVIVGLTLNDQRQVTRVDISLALDPQNANTEQEYDSTHLYEAFTLALESGCLESKIGVYRFFQNEVKSKIQAEPTATHASKRGTGVVTDNVTHAMNIPFCKHLISYLSDFGSDTSQATVGNPSGLFTFHSISFSDTPQALN